MNRIEVQGIKIVSNATQNGTLRACVWSRQTICLIQKLIVLKKLVTLFRSLVGWPWHMMVPRAAGSPSSIRQTTIHFGTAA
jgi:hypothetical protein